MFCNNIIKHNNYNMIHKFSWRADINECYDMKCSNENAECINTVGNYSCQCMEGYTGDGYNCTGIAI